MQLKSYTDYSLRMLIYLGMQSDRLVTIGEVAEAFGISRNHLMKVAQQLSSLGYVSSMAGRSGGLSLSREPSAINVGDVIKQMESDFDLVECFNATRNVCRLSPGCALKGMLFEAKELFLGSLERYTLQDILRSTQPLSAAAAHTGEISSDDERIMEPTAAVAADKKPRVAGKPADTPAPEAPVVRKSSR